MTEAEWLVCEDATRLVRCLEGLFNAHRKKAGRRKIHLLGCACVRDRWELLVDPRSREIVEISEEFADGHTAIDKDKLRTQSREAYNTVYWSLADTAHTAEERAIRDAQQAAAEMVSYLIPRRSECVGFHVDAAMRRGSLYDGDTAKHRRWRSRLRILARHLRDIFGNPFRPVTFPKAWRTEHTVGIAARMYDDRDFAAMPILADALEDAGCDNADILTHCREPGVHVRGCWVVDLVLGKA